MRMLIDDNRATLIPAWVEGSPVYAYDAVSLHCDAGGYESSDDGIYDYDVTRCTHSITSSTSGTTTFHGDAGFTHTGGCFSGLAAGGNGTSGNLPNPGCHCTATGFTSLMPGGGCIEIRLGRMVG